MCVCMYVVICMCLFMMGDETRNGVMRREEESFREVRRIVSDGKHVIETRSWAKWGKEGRETAGKGRE